MATWTNMTTGKYSGLVDGQAKTRGTTTGERNKLKAAVKARNQAKRNR